MQKGMMRCFRCDGRKKMFKINSGYTLVDMGGVSVSCPLCMGEGVIKTLEEAIDNLIENHEPTKKAPIEIPKKVKDDEKPKESRHKK
jgi:hypothetical protein